ncbi:hypothetical protein [Corynebacterium frankenforstense]|nr:hypothetical protein [Corynebacterium frankenforstense]
MSLSRPARMTLAAALGTAALTLGACTIGDPEPDAPVLTTRPQTSPAQSSPAASSTAGTSSATSSSTTTKAAGDPNEKLANGDGTYRLTDDAPDPDRPPEDVSATFSNLDDEGFKRLTVTFSDDYMNAYLQHEGAKRSDGLWVSIGGETTDGKDLEGMRCSFKHEIFDEAGVSISRPDPSEGFENNSCKTYVVDLPEDALGPQSVQVTIARPGHKPFVVRQDIINVG